MFFAKVTGHPIIEFAFGAVFSIVSVFVIRDLTRRARLTTFLTLVPTGAVAMIITSFIHAEPLFGEVLFLALVFVTTLVGTWHPRAVGMGLIAVVLTYVGLYLHLPPATIPYQLGGLATGAAVVFVVCFFILPLRPAVILGRAIRSVMRRAGAVLRAADRRSAGSPRLMREMGRLKRAALAAEDQLVLLDEVSRRDVQTHLFDLEQALRRLVDRMPGEANAPNDRRRRSRIQVAAARMHVGRLSRSASNASSDPFTEDLAALSRAAAKLRAAVARVVPKEPVPASMQTGLLAWRAAAQAALASLIAMVAGTALSPQRWFWAVIAVYVVFINARTRGDIIHKGAHRVVGTIAGLFAGLGLATLSQDNIAVECTIMLIAVFGMYYLAAVSYGVAIFCVTVLLGLIYGSFGDAPEPVLMLRLGETLLGVAAAIVTAVFVLPVPTRQQVKVSRLAVLRTLREAVGASVAAPRDGQAVVAAIRRLDRQVVDYRRALLPLTTGRLFPRRATAERPMSALFACVDAAHALAGAQVSTDGTGHAELVHDAGRVDQRISALLGESAAVPAGLLVDAGSRSPVRAALSRLDTSLAMLAERLEANALRGR
ncbi:hypothetical protein ASB57_04035 [Bordetella sp. N]|nr:hypothetical protein ASB57_04035 [Bordetella sp. N]